MTPRILVPPELLDQALPAGKTITLDRDQAHYLGQVLRLRVGDAIQVFDGCGKRYRASVIALEKKLAVISAPEPDTSGNDTPATLELKLAQGLARGDRMDWVIEKSTELGVSEIVPLAAENSTVRLSGQRAETRREHWLRVARAACMQCGQDTVPAIHRVVPLPTLLDELVLPQDDNPPRRQHLLTLDPLAPVSLAGWAGHLEQGRAKAATPGTSGGSITLFVGPESGFTAAEEQQLAAAGAQPVRLGPRILRTETAGIVALSVLQGLLGDLK